MREQVAYLDASATIKRYIKEPGSGAARELYLKACPGELVLSFSLWNIGEVLTYWSRLFRETWRLVPTSRKSYTKSRTW